MDRSQSEMDEQIGRANDFIDSGQNPYHGMSYLEGVRDALSWAQGDIDDVPIPDEAESLDDEDEDGD